VTAACRVTTAAYSFTRLYLDHRVPNIVTVPISEHSSDSLARLMGYGTHGFGIVVSYSTMRNRPARESCRRHPCKNAG